MSQTSEIPATVHSRNEDSLSTSTVNANLPRSDSGIPAVSVRNASKSFLRPDLPPIEAIDDISLDVDLGEFVVIVGPSGCGKSTLLNIIAGLAEPDIGSVSILKNSRHSRKNPHHSHECPRHSRADGNPDELGEQASKRIGRVAYMHQIDLLLPWRNVLSNATLGLEIAGIPRAEADAKATELAQRFGIADFLNAYPATLSGGMRQRVALLRAVLPDRAVLLLDEPFKALDAITRAELQRWLSDVLDRTNRATVMVTHDVEEALMLGDRVLVMSPRPGRILLELDVDLPRPRPRDVVREPNFVELKWQLLSALDDEAPR